MRFHADGPSIPDELLAARDEGRVVFFCGAGVSRARAGLPDFVGLASSVADRLAISRESATRKLIDQIKSYVPIPGVGNLISADRVFGLIERDFSTFHIYEAIAGSLKPGRDPDFSAHQIMIDLARGPDRVVRIVTTNFDLLFEACDDQLEVHRPPRLPDPRRTGELSGIVHLHGHVDELYSSAEGAGLVISSAEFGRAYLAEQWATNFVRGILERFVVVFVGYAADDPPMQYLLEALNRSAGSVTGAYAFQANDDAEAEARWLQKGVRPIVYDGASKHAALWTTLSAWAERARNPEKWFAHLTDRGMSGPRSLLPHIRGQIAHIVSSADGARRLALANPTLPAEWLCTFDRAIRYEKPGRVGRFDNRGPIFDPFEHYAIDSDPIPPTIDPDDFTAQREMPPDAWHAFSLLRSDRENLRDNQLPRFNGPLSNTVPSLASRLWWLGAWLTKVASQPASIWWAARQAGLHSDLAARIGSQLEVDNDMPASVRSAWRYLLQSWKDDRDGIEREYYNLARIVKMEGWTPANIRRLASLCRPYIRAKQAWFSAGSEPPKSGQDIPLDEMLHLEVEYPLGLREAPSVEKDLLPSLAKAMRVNLELGVALEAEIGGHGLQNLPCLQAEDDEPADDDVHHHGLSAAVTLYLQIFRRLMISNVVAAKEEAAAWSANTDSLFTRLKLWASGESRLCSANEAASTIVSLERGYFWDSRNQSDVLVTIARRIPEFDEAARDRIGAKIMEGRRQWRNESDGDYAVHGPAAILDRMHWLMSKGWRVSDETRMALGVLRAAVPQWKEEYASNAARSFDSRARWVKTDTDDSALREASISKVLEVADAVSGRSEDFFVQRDPFAGLIKERPIKALIALSYASKRGQYRVKYWRDLLTSDAWERRGLRFTVAVALRLARLPDEALVELVRPAADWLHRASELLRLSRSDTFELLWDRLCTAIARQTPDDGANTFRTFGRPVDFAMEALNSSSGNLAQALLADPSLAGAHPTGKLPEIWRQRAQRLLSLPGEPSRNALTIFAYQLGWLFRKDPQWALENLLTAATRGNEDEQAFWAGVFWANNIRSPQLFSLLKPSLVRLATESSLRKRQHNESLVGMLLAGWVTKDEASGERLISNDEVRDVLVTGDDDFRSQAVWYLNRWSRQAGSSWQTEALNFIAEVWPRHNRAKSSRVSARLVELAFSHLDQFPAYAAAVLPLLVKIDRDHINLVGAHEDSGDVIRRFPEEALALLSAVLPEDAHRWPYGMTDILTEIANADERLATDTRLVELNRIARR